MIALFTETLDTRTPKQGVLLIPPVLSPATCHYDDCVCIDHGLVHPRLFHPSSVLSALDAFLLCLLEAAS